jgi:hypothetical protein
VTVSRAQVASSSLSTSSGGARPRALGARRLVPQLHHPPVPSQPPPPPPLPPSRRSARDDDPSYARPSSRLRPAPSSSRLPHSASHHYDEEDNNQWNDDLSVSHDRHMSRGARVNEAEDIASNERQHRFNEDRARSQQFQSHSDGWGSSVDLIPSTTTTLQSTSVVTQLPQASQPRRGGEPRYLLSFTFASLFT